MALKYKIGDRVRIKSIDWYNENKDKVGNILYKRDGSAYPVFFSKYMSNFCGEILTIKSVFKHSYHMNETSSCEFWTDEMIEGLVEPIDCEKCGLTRNSTRCLFMDNCPHNKQKNIIEIPKDYVIKDENGNVINATKIVLEKKETNNDMNENNTKVDMGEVSDGYHTFNELYEYRMLYNAALFNEFAKQGLYDVHKSRKHSDGEYPFGDSNWFIVMAELPTGQISNHYEMKDWDKFQIPEKPVANKWDEHSPRDVANRLTSFTTSKKEYPKTYEECFSILGFGLTHGLNYADNFDYLYKGEELYAFQKLLVCRDAYWKIAGEEMGLGKPWEPSKDKIAYSIYRYSNEIETDFSLGESVTFEFPTEEMRDAFKENFDPDIEICKELL